MYQREGVGGETSGRRTTAADIDVELAMGCAGVERDDLRR